MDHKQFLFFLSPSSETRAPKNDHACRCSRAHTPFTKSEEKERLLRRLRSGRAEGKSL